MRKAVFSILLVVVLLAVAVIAEAQQAKKMSRIGLLSGSGPATNPAALEAFRQGLRELRYVDGGNILLEYRWAEGKFDRLPGLASELVGLRADVIVTIGTQATLAARQASNTIPIVVAGAGDLVGEGIVTSLARPGGNVTGLTAMSPDLSVKRLEILKESVPQATRFAVIWHRNPNDEKEVKATEVAALAMRVQLQSLPVQSPDEFQNAYAAMRKERAGALIFIRGPFLGVHRKQLFELAAKNRLPSICDAPSWTEEGCLMSYGPDRRDMFRRSAYYVDKILRGAKPADLPIEQPKKFEFIVNLKAAKQIGLTDSAECAGESG